MQCPNQIQNLIFNAPIHPDSSSLWLNVRAVDPQCQTWGWNISSANLQSSGEVVFRSQEDVKFITEFAKHERLIKHGGCLNLFKSKDSDDVLQGRNIYKSFARNY